MSRTFRKRYKKSDWPDRDGKEFEIFRDKDRRKHKAGGCMNNGECSWCKSNRLHNSLVKIEETEYSLKENEDAIGTELL